jgi:Nif-specific regulatory protein|uniref:Sigma-54-dependent Fis family transcriptional regulator n=1 Tax=Desulfobacca acetoxidans TaxID=60893 RepID=A0A7V6A4J3_9BACT
MGEGSAPRSSSETAAPGGFSQSVRPRLLTWNPPFQALLQRLPRLAATNLPVLITGEPGTGKELVAEALWSLSTRNSQPFYRVNCALLGGELATSELFGHLQGSFTGAARSRLGKFQQAHRGTLFLDEIGDLDPAVQPRLLRALEQGEVEPLGSDVTTTVDVRLLCATNQDLPKLLAEGRFRQDLYDRLAVLLVPLPPLRERGDDVLLLAEHFLEQEARRYQRPVVGLSGPTRRRLQEYHWPGNVRELKNVITRAVLFSTGHLLQVSDMAFAPQPQKRAHTSRLATPAFLPARPSREHLASLIRAEGGNVSALSRRLSVCSRTIYRWLRAYGLELKDFRSEDTRESGILGRQVNS